MMKEAVVFGLFETGLGVIRSLGKEKIKVIGIDFKKDIAWYSRYVQPKICPHPLKQEKEFLSWIESTFSKYKKKLPVFFTGDDFLMCFSNNRDIMEKYFMFNLPDRNLLQKIGNKDEQYELVKNAGIDVPKTVVIHSKEEANGNVLKGLNFPVFIKALNVNSWREKISGKIKGYEVKNSQELELRVIEILNKKVPIILQEVIIGGDSNHFKYCSYTSKNGDVIAEFTLRKIRQRPIHYGVGSAVESIENENLAKLGRKLFKEIGFAGIGSAEFKLDERDNKLKLIEINPRYWQQNYLSTECGINFPLINFSDLRGNTLDKEYKFEVGVKWVNRYADLDSYLSYRKEGLSFFNWRKSLKGKKIFSDFTWDDPVPLFYEIGFGWKLVKAPWFIIKRISKR